MEPILSVEQQKTLIQLAGRLRDALNSFEMLYDEHDPEASELITKFDAFETSIDPSLRKDD
jgi:hypothetical protein